MTQASVEQRLAKAKVKLILDHPFFGSLICRLPFKDATGLIFANGAVDTMATDGRHIFYCPEYVQKQNDKQLLGLIVHEIYHPMFQHHLRRGERNFDKWNRACDYAINPLILNQGFELPVDGLNRKDFFNLTAEEIYSRLKDKEEGGGSSYGMGGVMDATKPDGTPASSVDRTAMSEEWKSMVAQAAQQARAMGKLPAGLEIFIEELLNPQVDWREVLRRFVSEQTKTNYRWFPPNRRYVWQGLYMPSINDTEKLNVTFVWDASGSMWDKDLMTQIASEATGILEDFNAEGRIIYHDSVVQHVVDVRSEDLPIKFSPKGGGGTDFACVFDYVREHDFKVDCMVFFTDLAGSFPDYIPDYPVIWAHVEDYETKVPFGEVVKIYPTD